MTKKSQTDDKVKKVPAKKTPRKRISFVEKQLTASGLTLEDVMATVSLPGEENVTRLSPFRRGGIDQGNGKSWLPKLGDDEMLIYYYDRKGAPRMYARRGAAGSRTEYVRVRWSNPDDHLLGGRPTKYQSPPKSESIIYIPQHIRNYVVNGEKLDTLYIQEGEKKAEKACKHGIPSIAIQGIWNIGNKENGLDRELQYLMQDLEVKNVVMIFDSDFDHLSASISRGDEITKRPASFCGAIIKFRKYIRSLKNVDINAEIWFAHIIENENGDKGLDDLLVNSLNGEEDRLKEDFDFAKNAIDGVGKYVEMHCITTISETKIKDFWKLNDKDAFFERYREQLIKLKEFRFSNLSYEVVDGQFKNTATYSLNEDLWEVEISDKGKESVKFDKMATLDFLASCGFSRYAKKGHQDDSLLLYDDNGVIKPIEARKIRDFFWQFILQNSKSKLIRNYFYDSIDSHLSDAKLQRLPIREIDFSSYTDTDQFYYFKNAQCRINQNGIETGSFCGPAWEYKIINRNFERIPIIKDIQKSGDSYTIELYPEAEECEFFKFLKCVSTIRKTEGVDQDEEWDVEAHLVNKITSIGYLLSEFKSFNESLAIVAMDYTVSEDNEAMGGTGKSIIGRALSYFTKIYTIDGKKDVSGDQFLLSLVTDQTRIIFLDDVKKSFQFSCLYNVITSDIEVNPKQEKRYIIPQDQAPKLYIATNYAITDNDQSTERRINYILFSNYFSKTYTPFNEFGHDLFQGWDNKQWNLFDNFMIECVFTYFKSRQCGWSFREGLGVVQPPLKSVDRKKYKMMIPIPFYEWAETYYSEDSGNLNIRQTRLDVLIHFRNNFADAKAVSSATFKKYLIFYCQYKGYDFNRHKPNKAGKYYSEWHAFASPGEIFVGTRDSSGGTEYFIISTPNASL